MLPLVGRPTGGSVHSEEAGREDSAPKSFHHRDADAVSLAEGSIRTTDNARLAGVAGVPSPGHAFKRISREPRRAADLSRAGYGFCPTQKEPGPEGNEGVPREANRPSTWSTCRQGRPEVAGTGRQQSYEPIIPTKVGNRRASVRSGHGTHWREGVNRLTYRCGATYTRHRTRESMSNESSSNS